MKNCVTKFQHHKTKNQTVKLIFIRYCTYPLICFVFYLKNDDASTLKQPMVRNSANGTTK